MKKRFIFIALFALLLAAGCSKKDETTPNEVFKNYTAHWNKLEFEEMYDMLATASTSTYPPEQFIDRYEKIYQDLEIDDLKVTFEPLKDEEVKKAFENGKATIPFQAKMTSTAGEITFDYKAKLVQQGDEEEKNWFIDWNPGYIFPEIKDGGEISIKSISPTRGEILDRFQMPLAINDLVWEIGIVPEKLGDQPEQQKKRIAQLLNISVDKIDKELSAGWVEPHLFVPLKKVAKTNEELLNQLWETPGIMGREVNGRVYPLGKAAAHLIGYVAPVTAEDLEKVDRDQYAANDVIGKRGIEQLYEEQLKGERGVQIIIKYQEEEKDDVILAEKPVKDGENIMLTIDSAIQEITFDAYEKDSGTAAAIDPTTGETLALVSSPAFDPNAFQFGISQATLEAYEKDERQPLINRFAATYAPGSVIKPITAAIGLENGTIKPGEGVTINGLTWSNGKGWGDYKVRRVSESSGPVDVKDALIRSDNIYFAMKAVEMGSKKYISGLESFGLGDKFPFSYPITGSTISANGELNGEVMLANTSYGQGQIQFSSLHMAIAYTPFLNEGNLLKPTLLASEEKGQVWQKSIVSKEHADLIETTLREVVTKGTGKKAQDADFPISGKTGTAELKLSADTSGKENGWFVGYPTKDRDILIAMMVEGTEDRGGSSYTVKKVTDILKALK
ncbi:penicillin-binding transpeptidase domain-containing protein [Ornithinibacillus gellani]|uniref:penicillin-binding transpeptidase domain-containing protein n=1 Tax=Ornithinibacillus gellani TaxID=2293253 RepID=UPI000F4A1EE2|nr:penicillin-binding transpeptidase domain-containing protein [Ornithinibacillus gellani]TQS74846.1 penicillin-binding transpeptidase domain-containing protein [Ornithinibacillus gellani]